MSSGCQSSFTSYSDSDTVPAARTSAASDISGRRICRCSLRLNNSEKVSHEQFAKLAEAELSAYHRTMSEQFGNAFADAATEHWFRAFADSKIDPADPRRSLRRATIHAIANALAG
jgi:hypothetical protein